MTIYTKASLIQAIMDIYQRGGTHQLAGTRYPADEMSFRQTISGHTRSDRGFKVIVDRSTQRVVISFAASEVSRQHADWLENVEERTGLAEISPQPLR